ncbi:MAG: hypothetical protein AAB933_00400 [Patescibacteria group bacterium]
MTRFILPVILIGVSVAVFFVFTNPLYNDIGLKKAEVDSYDEALANSKMLENERDKLTAKYNSFNPENLAKLSKLLPESVDNIRLILEIEQIALPYGMALKDVKYSNVVAPAGNGKGAVSASPAAGTSTGGAVQASNKDYGVWDLSFSTTGSYGNFLNFTRDLENNLRLVDVSSIQFSSSGGGSFSSSPPDSYKYDFKIKTYWLKN